MAYTNITNIPLSVAVWLATDTYDAGTAKNYVSATSLLNPIKATVLNLRISNNSDIDLADLTPAKIGNAVHDSIEQAWVTNYVKALKSLNYPEKVTKAILINPDGPVPDSAVPIYIEKRKQKEINGFTIGGKFDIVITGQLEDFKTTKTYSWINQSNKRNYVLQGSIYRWLNQDIITEDFVAINYIFTDWSQVKAIADKTYPSKPILQQKYPLLSVQETERYLIDRTTLIRDNMHVEQSAMPQCTQEELWQKDPVYKYFKNPAKTQRSTKNYTNKYEAYARLATEGVGVVKAIPGEVKRCNYCSARGVCQQAENLELQGLLK